MPNQIPRKQILENLTQTQDMNMRKNNIRPADMREYNTPMTTPMPSRRPTQDQYPMTQRPTQTQAQPQMPQRPSATDIPQTNYTQVEPTPQGTPDVDFTAAQIGIPVFDPEFTQGYLRQNIGKKVKVEFLIGTNMLIDREGVLVDVGISYIIIIETETDDLLLCDIYSIKFVRFYR